MGWASCVLPPRASAAPTSSRFESSFAERTRRHGRTSRACAPATRRDEKRREVDVDVFAAAAAPRARVCFGADEATRLAAGDGVAAESAPRSTARQQRAAPPPCGGHVSEIRFFCAVGEEAEKRRRRQSTRASLLPA